MRSICLRRPPVVCLMGLFVLTLKAPPLTADTTIGGTIIRVNSGKAISIGDTSVSAGVPIAQGTSDAPIVFTSNQAVPAPGDWKGI